MNATLPLLLCLLSTSLAMEEKEEEEDALQTSRASLPNPKASSCPEPDDILPCVCKEVLQGLSLDCSEVEDEDQLRQVFTANFPVSDLYEFVMDGNKGVRVLEDGVFAYVSFQVVRVVNSALETITDIALTPSFATLTRITVTASPLAVFPFDILWKFTSLENVFIEDCDVHSLPSLSSSTLKELHISSNSISYLSSNVFTLLTAVQTISLEGNHLTGISEDTFTSIPRLSSLSLSANMISSLSSLTFALTASQNAPASLLLDHNYIDSVEVDAFKGVQAPSHIELSHNALTTLQEEVWRPVLERGVTVGLEGNSLSCGCVVAWLVKDPALLTMAQDARCADGTLLTDLDPADFDIC